MRMTDKTKRALLVLFEGMYLTAENFGARMWPDNSGRCAAHGGGFYAAQMYLGRLRAKGLVRPLWTMGATTWCLTEDGAREIRQYWHNRDLDWFEMLGRS